MSIYTVITGGFGPVGTASLVVTDGYQNLGAVRSGYGPNISMRSGFVTRPADLTPDWNGIIVRRSEADRRNPQDFVRGRVDRQGVPDPRPEAADTFLTAGDVTEDDL